MIKNISQISCVEHGILNTSIVVLWNLGIVLGRIPNGADYPLREGTLLSE